MLLLLLALLVPGEDPPEIKAIWACNEAVRLREPSLVVSDLKSATPSLVIFKLKDGGTIACAFTQETIEISRTR